MTKVIEINDNINRMFGLLEIPDNPIGVVVFSHGLLSGVVESQRFSHIKQFLHSNNVATIGTYLPAHGLRKNESFSIENSVHTLENTIDYVRSNFSGMPVGFLGISIGSSFLAYLHDDYISSLSSIVLISLITDLSIFKHFKFEWNHYKRWKTYGYSEGKAKEIFQVLVGESLNRYDGLNIHEKIMGIHLPKLIIHGLNDRVTSYRAIVDCLDDYTALTVFPGIEGTHDIKGHCLDSAAKICSNHFSHYFLLENNKHD